MTEPVPLAPSRRLAEGAIGLWFAPVAQLLTKADPEAALPEREREHCRRYRHPQARRRALAVRLLAHRALLWLDPEAASWPIAHDPRGQPRLPDPALAISLAHSGDIVACALGRVAALGVDVEAIRPRPRLLAFARRYYSAAEVAGLEALAEAERLAAFYDIWTLREAWLKARGCGLAGYRSAPCTRDLLAGGVPDWQWQQVTDEPGYRLALCWRVDASGQAEVLRSATPPWPQR